MYDHAALAAPLASHGPARIGLVVVARALITPRTTTVRALATLAGAASRAHHWSRPSLFRGCRARG